MTVATPQLLTTAAALLDQGRSIDRLSRLLTAASLIGMLFYQPVAGRAAVLLFASLVALAGLAETYFAVRVGFDATLFRQVANAAAAPDFAATDAALAQLGLLPAAKLGRPADARIAGARRLFRRQIMALAIQVILVLLCAGLALARL